MSSSNYQGAFIAVFGPDGSGKSTVFQEFEKRCNKLNIKIDHYHWRPGALPYKQSFKSVNNNNFTDPQNTKPKSKIGSYLSLLYIYIDFLIGYYYLISPKLRKGYIIYYERFFYDILVDEKRYGLKTNYHVRWFFAKLIPRPSILVLLDASPHIINSRKNELSIDVINKQLVLLKTVLPAFQQVISINVEDNNPKEVVDILFEQIINE